MQISKQLFYSVFVLIISFGEISFANEKINQITLKHSNHQSTEQEKTLVYLYNLEPVKSFDYSNLDARRRSWDETHLVVSLQGLVNREEPRLYLFFVENFGKQTDRFWLDVFSKENPSTGEKGWLQDCPQQEIADLESLLTTFRNQYQGVVVYDERIPATSNLASSIAGADDLLCLRFDENPDSLYHKLVVDPDGLRLPVVVSLIGKNGEPLFNGKGKIPGTDRDSTGSSKADAYYWLIEHYIKTGKCLPNFAGYYLDAYWISNGVGAVQNHLLTNHDYFIANKGFFFDLSPWEDELPVDDKTQPLGTDYQTFCDILRAAYEQNQGKKMIHVGGFTPWDTKYTDYGNIGGKHSGVQTEWRHAEILSCFNAYMDADALGCGAMANASFFAHFPLRDIYPQKKPTLDDLKNRGFIDPQTNRPIDRTFVTIYVGDYDSAAWVYQTAPLFWNDENRGNVPIGWAFNPNLADRFAPGFDYFRKTATPNDYFVAGDSGAGYLNPMNLLEPRKFSGLPSGLKVWQERCLKYYRQWDISITGFIIDGFAPPTDELMRESYRLFSPDGAVMHQGGRKGITNGMPWTTMHFDLSDPEMGTRVILGDTRLDDGPQFLIYRTILWSPSKMRQMFESVQNNQDQSEKAQRVIFLDPYSFFLLLKLQLENNLVPFCENLPKMEN
ncbi:MAG: GxGYxYP family putative glycoside hydrolase [Planctomycetia bacterium]|nr:GxGYxYP family putative glycoside hydrolase [Planctomycetia bacterium]